MKVMKIPPNNFFAISLVSILLLSSFSVSAEWEVITHTNTNSENQTQVAFNENERLIGDAAKSQAANNPENTVFDAKRLIGKSFNDTVVQNDIKYCIS